MAVTVTAEPWDSADGAALRAMQRLHGLEAEARARGFAELKLETGTAQPDAMRFYEREGYGLIDNFGVYAGEPLSVCYVRSL